MNDLVKLEQAVALLAECTQVSDAKQIRDLAKAAEVYAREQKLGQEAENKAYEIKVRAERRMGELLKAQAANGERRARGETDKKIISTSDDIIDKPSLAELGLTLNESSKYQKLAEVPADTFEKVARREVKLREAFRQQKRDLPAPAPIAGMYRVWYADPPWDYGNSGLDEYGHAERHYPTMTIQQLCELGEQVRACSEADAVLFLWVTSPLLDKCFEVVRAWGFQYKSSFIWDKEKHNFGYYNSVRHEFLLICTRGSCVPDIDEKFDSVISIARGEHSAKPSEFRQLIDTLYPRGNRIELFARAEAEGWERWGNEAT